MIHKITTSWIKSVNGEVLTSAFSDAWANVVNALNGVWGETNYRPLKGVESLETEVQVIKSRFTVDFETNLEGDYTLVIPYPMTNFARVRIQYVSGISLASEIVYIVNQGTSLGLEELPINLSSGRKLITITGTARRV